MKLYFVFIALCVLAVCESCENSEKKFCQNELNLLSPHDSIPSIILDFSRPDSDLEKQIRTATTHQDQKLPQKFRLTLNGINYNASIHAKHQNSLACYGMPAMMHRSPQLEVFITGNGTALMEGKDLIPLDSIPGYIQWYFPHDKPFGEKIVKVNKSALTNNSSFEYGISQVANGYLNYYQKRAQELYQTPVCELDSTQINQISKHYPFEIRLWIGDPSAVFQ